MVKLLLSCRGFTYFQEIENTRCLIFFPRKRRFANLVNVTDAIVKHKIFQRGKVSRRNLK